MRDSRETPTPLEPGKRYKMKIKLDDIAWRVPKGHKIRVSISTTYFPMMWPAPEPVTLTVYSGKSLLHLPLRKDIAAEAPLSWKGPEAAPAAEMTELRPSSNKRETVVDETTGEMKIEIVDDFGEQEIHPHGMIISALGPRELFDHAGRSPVGEDGNPLDRRTPPRELAYADGDLRAADGDRRRTGSCGARSRPSRGRRRCSRRSSTRRSRGSCSSRSLALAALIRPSGTFSQTSSGEGKKAHLPSPAAGGRRWREATDEGWLASQAGGAAHSAFTTPSQKPERLIAAKIGMHLHDLCSQTPNVIENRPRPNPQTDGHEWPRAAIRPHGFQFPEVHREAIDFLSYQVPSAG